MENLDKELESVMNEKELEQDIIKNVFKYCKTKDEKFHGLAVRGIKQRFGLQGESGNKIFWILKQNMDKKIAAKNEVNGNE